MGYRVTAEGKNNACIVQPQAGLSDWFRNFHYYQAGHNKGLGNDHVTLYQLLEFGQTESLNKW